MNRTCHYYFAIIIVLCLTAFVIATSKGLKWGYWDFAECSTCLEEKKSCFLFLLGFCSLRPWLK